MQRRRLLVLLATGLLALGLAACSSSSKSSSSTPAATSGGDAQITIDSSFTFKTTPVKAGSTVTVKNESGTNHTVTSDTAGAFNVALDANGTATFTAPDKPGSYPFHCNIHSFMHGTLTVT